MIQPVAERDVALEQRCIDTIRFLAVDAVQRAKSGHPGTPMGAAPMAHVLFTRHLRFNPHGPRLAGPRPLRAVGRSRQHAAVLAAAPDRLRPDDRRPQGLPPARQQDAGASRVRLHARRRDHHRTARPGLRATRSAWPSPRRISRATFNDAAHVVVDHRTYVIASDGDLMEGVSSEASSLAGHLGLGKLIVLYDDNHISIDGSTDLAFTEDRCAALRGLRLARAVRRRRQRPRGHRRRADGGRGRGGPAVVHRRAHPHRLRLAQQAGHGERARRAARRGRGEADQGEPGLAARAGVLRARRGLRVLRARWRTRAPSSRTSGARAFAAWKAADPARAARWETAWARELPEGWDDDLPVFEPSPTAPATRAASGKALEALLPRVPALIGGSGDLTPSNNTRIKAATRLPARHAGGPLHPLRRARARHGGYRQRALPARRPAALRRHLLHLQRLPASRRCGSAR